MNKPSFRHTLHRSLYTNGEETDYDYIRLAKKCSELTFNKDFLNPQFNPAPHQTPFNEIIGTKAKDVIKSEYDCIFEPQLVTKLNVPEFAMQLKNIVKEYFLQVWDSNKNHIVFHSAGYDSRIISIVLMELREEKGSDWIGQIHFRCHQPECDDFNEIMKREGWDKSQYSCWEGSEKDYYDVGRKEVVLNGFVSYVQQMNFWSDIIPLEEEKHWVVITGVGDTIYKDFTLKKKYKTNLDEKFNYSMLDAITTASNLWNGIWECMWLSRFNDLLLPFFGYEYLKISLTANMNDLKWIDTTDNIRKAIIESNNYGVDFNGINYGRHNYVWNISENRQKQMIEDYYNSEFFNKIGVEINETELFENMGGWDAKLWGFMTAFDAIINQSN